MNIISNPFFIILLGCAVQGAACNPAIEVDDSGRLSSTLSFSTSNSRGDFSSEVSVNLELGLEACRRYDVKNVRCLLEPILHDPSQEPRDRFIAAHILRAVYRSLADPSLAFIAHQIWSESREKLSFEEYDASRDRVMTILKNKDCRELFSRGPLEIQ